MGVSKGKRVGDGGGEGEAVESKFQGRPFFSSKRDRQINDEKWYLSGFSYWCLNVRSVLKNIDDGVRFYSAWFH